MDLMNRNIFTFNKDKTSIIFNANGDFGRFELINFMVDEFHNLPKENWSSILNNYFIEVKKYFNPGITTMNSVLLAGLMLPVHDHPIFEINDEFSFGEELQNGNKVKFTRIEFRISAKSGKAIEHTFRFSYEKSNTVKEEENYGVSGMGISK
jgi:hypothetical protein